MKHYHFFEHIYRQTLSLFLSLVASFYITTMLISSQTIVAAVVSSQIFFGLIVYQYLHFGYDLSPRERCGFREFIIGMLPSQAIAFLWNLLIYAAFSFFYGKRIFESLPIHRLAANTVPMGYAFALTEAEILSLREDMEKIPELPKELFPMLLFLFLIMMALNLLISYVCYRRGIFLRERERKETLLGIQRKKKGSFAARFWFFPIVNILPIFPYIYRHLFRVEYRIRDMILPLILIGGAKLLLDYLASWAIFYINTAWMYFIAHFLSIWLWGILISRLMLAKEKEWKKRE